MSKLHVTQIAGYLQKNLEGKIDLSDYAHHKDPAEREKAFLTRALATLAASHLTDRPITDFADSVTDGSHDGGVDLIHFNEKDKTLYLVQTKWHDDGNGSIAQGDMLKFISGVKKIIDLNIDDFNERIKKRTPDIKSAVYDANAKIVLVVAHTGADNLSDVVRADIESYIDQQNDTSEIMTLEVMNQSLLHKAVSAGLAGNPIDVDIQLLNWGQLREPHRAVYGRVFASDVASWYQNNGPKLFEKNLRQFLPVSTVNQDLVETLLKKPGEFWYFNNGITAVARSVEKKLLGGNQTDTGIWECKGFSVVNGAQTVGSIHAAHSIDPEVMGNATVSVRIIEIVEDDDAFGLDVTRNTNTQNSVEKRDFVALDPEQERIRQELRFDGIDYAYKSGAAKGDPEKHFDLTEATIALACNSADVSLAVQAKREISRLWDDIQKAPYRTIFNNAISGPQIWNLVQILRHVERDLARLLVGLEGRESLIGIHGNRFVQWETFRKLGVTKHTRYVDVSEKIAQATTDALADVITEVQVSYADSYPASLFKNQTKCKAIAARI
ncbi:AIPR family protein [Rhizobium bangladeshense]|uniref:AIPR family protein n=1 Tax=Rhizobium TaxID=379 RepID=UPI001C832F6F|nr:MULTISPECIES: AIPR family protein [Rhizobium]MBX4874444.1 AIPR family protein [Rhizobium bangladeshense]MBX5179436.1 AIPR family protein [Rhizobium lentis]